MMQAADTTTTPLRREVAPPLATGVARRDGQAFEQLLALTADGYLQSFAQEIRSLVPGDTSASSGRGNAHARRLSVLQAEDAQSAMGMRASELSGLTPRGQRLGAQRAELARSAASGTSSDDSRAGGGGTRETPAETNQLNGPKTRAISAAAASDQLAKATLSNGGAGQSRSDPSASRPFSNDLNGAAESRTAQPLSAVPLSGTTAAQASSAVAGSSRSGDVARQVADALLGRAGSASGGAGGSARAGSLVTPLPETSSGSRAGLSAKGSPRPGVPDRAARDEAGTEATSKPAFRKLLKSIHLSTGTRKSTARILLNPPELGRMRVEVRLDGQRLFIKIRTEHRQALELLAKNVHELRQSLERHGVRVEQFELRTGMNDERLPAEAPSYVSESDRQPWQRRARHDSDSADRQRSVLSDPTEEDELSDVRGTASPRPVAGDRRLDVRV